MSKGIIYIMTTVVPGLIKIGKTGLNSFDQRMYQLEHNGYSNVTALKRHFAIEVEDYDEKETLLHTIFAKSQVGDTELFAVDVNVCTQLLSSFDGNVIFPKDETKNEIFDTATENSKSKLIPNGIYSFQKKKKSDNKTVKAKAKVENGRWTLLKGSNMGLYEDAGVSRHARIVRTEIPIDKNGKLLEDYEIGDCSPSFAGVVVLNSSINGWIEWKNDKGEPVDVYRRKSQDE